MSEAQPAHDTVAALQAQLAAWRSEGQWRADPARFLALEALSRRLPGQPEPVQRLLQRKLQAGLAQYAQRLLPVQGAAPHSARATPGAGPVEQLNAYVREAARAARPPASEGEAHDPGQLASVRRFRQFWDRAMTLDRVEQAVSRKPANAGPLNSHVLVLRSLDMMRELSPEYLRRFVGYAESLQWLEQARAAQPAAAGKVVTAGKSTAGTSARARRAKK